MQPPPPSPTTAEAAQGRALRLREDPAEALQRMVEARLLDSDDRVLCYGCGQGADVTWLKMRKFQVEGYDPYPPFGYTAAPSGRYHQVMLVYLMARLKTDAARRAAVAKAGAFVRPGGHLVFVSRTWPRLLAEAGHSGREGLLAYFNGLVDGSQFEAAELLELPCEDRAVTVRARRRGTYRAQTPYVWVDRQEDAEALCAALAREPFVGLDVETTLDEPRRLCTIQLAVPGQTWIIDALALDSFAPIKALMENPAVEKIIHNSFFEEQMLGKHQIKIKGIFDTLHASRKKHKGAGVDGHKLGDVCERELGIFLDKENQTSDWTLRPLRPDQLDYAAIDAEVLIALHQAFQPPRLPEALSLF